MKINYKNISGKPDLTSFRCQDCIFTTGTCYTPCKRFNYCVFTKSKGDIFDENLL